MRIVTISPVVATAAPVGVGTLAALPAAGGAAAGAVGTSLATDAGGVPAGVAPGAAAPGALFGAGGGMCSCCHAFHRKNADEKKITNRRRRRRSVMGMVTSPGQSAKDRDGPLLS